MEEPTKEIIQFITSTLKESKDFVIEQSPDVIQQYLGAQAISCYVYGFIAITAIILGILCFIIAWRTVTDCDTIVGFIMVGMILCVIGFMFGPKNIIQYQQITEYPKGYLLEQVLKR